MIGDAGPGDEPFVAVDHPVVAFLLGTGADHAGIGAAAGRRLGHGEGGTHLALDNRLEPFVLLRRRADAREQVHVAVVGRRAIKRERAEDRAVRFLVHYGPAHDRQPHAAVILRRLRRPQTLGLGLGLYGAQHIEADVLVIVVAAGIGFERQHVRLHEAARAQADVLDLGGKGKVHCKSFLRRGGQIVCRALARRPSGVTPGFDGYGARARPVREIVHPRLGQPTRSDAQS